MKDSIKKYVGKPFQEVVKEAEKKFIDSKLSSVEAIEMLKLCINTPSINKYYRGILKQKVWEIEKSLGSFDSFFSQAGQDKYIDDIFFKGKSDGKFVEIGVYDGILGSNSLYFEKFLKWEGIIIEPLKLFINTIKKFRSAYFENVAISRKEGFEEFLFIENGYKQMGGLLKTYDKKSLNFVRKNIKHKENITKIQTKKLENILDKYKFYKIDYCSIDVEGAEENIISNFDFNKFDIKVFSVENNNGKKNKISEIMEKNNYKLFNIVGKDEIWSKK